MRRHPSHAAARLTRCACLLLAVAGPASAQADPPEDRWRIGLNLAFTGLSGNENLLVLTGGVKVAHLWTDRYELEGTAQTRYGRSEGDIVARNVRGTVNFNFNPNGVWTPFLFTTAEHDPLKQVRVRMNNGAGTKYTFWRVPDVGAASLSLAALYSYEDYTLTLGSAVDPRHSSARWSWRFKGERQLGAAVLVEHTTFWQPVWDQLNDYLASVTSTMRVRVSQNVALRVTHGYERDSTPRPDVAKDDHRLETGLTIEF